MERRGGQTFLVVREPVLLVNEAAEQVMAVYLMSVRR
jgi:hypothetical protein